MIFLQRICLRCSKALTLLPMQKHNVNLRSTQYTAATTLIIRRPANRA